jgi:hypothetical protein
MKSWLLLLVVGAACVRAPDVVIVDRKTALEQQASGSFRGLEEELEQAGLLPRAVPLTAAQLEEAGVARGTTGDAPVETSALPDSLLVDSLLVSRCLGEAQDGTVVLTVATCTGAMDVPQTNRMIERVNRNRRQLWQWISDKNEAPVAEVQARWREVHVAGMVCGGQLQAPDGSWEVKKC